MKTAKKHNVNIDLQLLISIQKLKVTSHIKETEQTIQEVIRMLAFIKFHKERGDKVHHSPEISEETLKEMEESLKTFKVANQMIYN